MSFKWNAFLQNKELNDLSNYHRKPDGKYLFGKILHDLLHFLKGYNEWVKLVMNEYHLSSMTEPTKLWMINMQDVIKQIGSDVSNFWRFYQTIEATSPKWPELIRQISEQVERLPKLIEVSEHVPLPDDAEVMKIVQTMIANLKKAEKIRVAIRDENYKYLWITSHHDI